MPKERIEVQKYFSIPDCLNNPYKLYVFDDNLIHTGFGGQAIIRNCANSYGIPTKRFPMSTPEAYFSDQPDEMNRVAASLNNLLKFYTDKIDWVIVFPEDGIGTRSAKLSEKSPKIYSLIDRFFSVHFNLHTMPEITPASS